MGKKYLYCFRVNCDTRAAKILRHYYTRPYFLPQMAQASSTNMLIVAKGKQDEWFEVFRFIVDHLLYASTK